MNFTVVAVAAELLAVASWASNGTAGESKVTAPSAIQCLQAGNLRFASDKPNPWENGKKRRAELARGQDPFAVVLTCADSRVAPEIIFDQGLGDLFVLRVAGNLADGDMIGSTEFALTQLHVPLVVVLGHEGCGAVKAAFEKKKVNGELGKLIEKIEVGSQQASSGEEAFAGAIQTNAKFQAEQLKKKSSIIRELTASGRVRIVTAIYSLKTGKVTWLEDETLLKK